MHEQRCSQQEQEAEEPLSGGNAVPKEAEEPLSGGNAFPKEAGRFVFCWTRSKRKRPNRRVFVSDKLAQRASSEYPSLELRCNSECGVSRTGSNHRPLASKAKALPLSYKVDARMLGCVRSLAHGMWLCSGGIEPSAYRLQNEGSTTELYRRRP
ncbi:hypothetical protein PC116_g17622 [Phytophthora cactorum]|nr:hypothetical protein PC116_g17622 [Phytophthora cactorum]